MPLQFAASDEADGGYRLTLLGETAPVLDPDGAVAATVTTTKDVSGAHHPPDIAARLYDYRWTLEKIEGRDGSGEPSLAHVGHHVLSPLHAHAEPPTYPAFEGFMASVAIWFPTTRGWVVRDRAAGVNHLSPLPPDLREELAKDWQDMAPIIEGAGRLAAAASPLAGPVATEAGKSLAALAQIRVTSVPQSTLPWWVATAAKRFNRDVYHGVVWTLTETLLGRLGGRVSGSVVVSFISATDQAHANEAATPRKGAIRAEASLVHSGEQSKTISLDGLIVEPTQA